MKLGTSRIWWYGLGLILAGTYFAGGLSVAFDGVSAVSTSASLLLHQPTPTSEPLPVIQTGDSLDGFPRWGSEGRVNILLLGIDARPDETEGPTRTDFVAVATIDPKTMSAGLISFPRDLLTQIPVRPGQMYEDRINTAFLYGELNKYPGGGVALAQRTVELNFGIPTQAWMLVDFDGVIKLIDSIGGVTVDVLTPLKDEEYPTENYGYKRLYVAPGLQHLTGAQALEYARSRHQDSDFERNRRQQSVLLGLRDVALKRNLLFQAPNLLAQTSSYFKTSLQPNQIIALARAAWTIDTENIVVRALDNQSATGANVYGASVLRPNRQAISELVAEVFSDPRIRREAANVRVVANVNQPKQAERLVAMLLARGFHAAIDISTEPSAVTVIVDGGKHYTATALSALLPGAVRRSSEDGTVTVFLGDDFGLPTS